MRKYIKPISYVFTDEDTEMNTIDKKFAAMVFKYLWQTVKAERDDRDRGKGHYEYNTNFTDFFTNDKKLALIVLKHARDNSETALDEQIARLEEEIAKEE